MKKTDRHRWMLILKARYQRKLTLWLRGFFLKITKNLFFFKNLDLDFIIIQKHSEMFQSMIFFKTVYNTKPNVTNVTLIMRISTLFFTSGLIKNKKISQLYFKRSSKRIYKCPVTTVAGRWGGEGWQLPPQKSLKWSIIRRKSAKKRYFKQLQLQILLLPPKIFWFWLATGIIYVKLIKIEDCITSTTIQYVS